MTSHVPGGPGKGPRVVGGLWPFMKWFVVIMRRRRAMRIVRVWIIFLSVGLGVVGCAGGPQLIPVTDPTQRLEFGGGLHLASAGRTLVHGSSGHSQTARPRHDRLFSQAGHTTIENPYGCCDRERRSDSHFSGKPLGAPPEICPKHLCAGGTLPACLSQYCSRQDSGTGLREI